jgi:hypothetical protein
MGLFLAMSGVNEATIPAVEAALTAYASEKGLTFKPASSGNPEDVLRMAESGNRCTIIYPGDFVEWDGVSAFLSLKLQTSVMSLHIHDGDLWMYTMFDKGKKVDQFNSIPDYWGELSEDEAKQWKGNAVAVAEHWPSLRAESIERYLVTWDLDDDDPGKAYPDDEFAYGTDWQVVDFMRKLGLTYPGSAGRMYEFHER